MVIGFDGSRAFIKGRTGTENYSYQLLKALAKIDRVNEYRVYVRPDLEKKVLQVWPKNFKFLTLNFKFLWTQWGFSLQTFKDKLDVLFVPAHTLPLIRKPGLKTVVTVHDLGSRYLPRAHQLKQRLYLGLMQNYQLKGASKIIAVSKATKTDLMRAAVKESKIKVIYEAYDKEKFKPVRGDTLVNSLKHYRLQSGNYLLFVGTVQPRKNLERLIVAFSRFINRPNSKFLQLVIAGSKGWLADDIYRLPARLGIKNRIKFLGYALEKDLPVLYSGAMAFLFPSLFEGFGLPILEAQACGCPVLTSNLSSMPEVSGKGAILVNPYSTHDIVKGLTRIMNQESRIKVIKAGSENVKRFSWEKCAKETLEVFEKV